MVSNTITTNDTWSTSYTSTGSNIYTLPPFINPDIKVDEAGEELKRIMAFTSLKIINVEIGDNDIIIHLKFKNKKFRLWIINGEMILYDKDKEICRVSPKNKFIPNLTATPYWPTPNTTTPWITTTTDNTGDYWYIDNNTTSAGSTYVPYL